MLIFVTKKRSDYWICQLFSLQLNRIVYRESWVPWGHPKALEEIQSRRYLTLEIWTKPIWLLIKFHLSDIRKTIRLMWEPKGRNRNQNAKGMFVNLSITFAYKRISLTLLRWFCSSLAAQSRPRTGQPSEMFSLPVFPTITAKGIATKLQWF